MTRPTAAAILALLAPAAWPYDLVGPENCKQCHATAYAAWRDSPHARAAAGLTGRFVKDGRCLNCHAPESSRGFTGVQCETCHGGGQYYHPRYVMKDAELARAVGLTDPTEPMCLKCHDAAAPSLKPFAFAEKVRKIDHWTAEREARKAAKAKPPPPPPPKPPVRPAKP